MLTKEECMKALDSLSASAKLISCCTWNYEKVLRQLINEHFELVEKTTTKKVIVNGIREGRTIKTVSYTCPSCGNRIGRGYFCEHCGQVLGWDNDNA